MGYYVNGYGRITIEHDKVDDAYKAMCDLNQRDDLKLGGSWGGSGLTSDNPRPEGMSYHPARWFSWMDADYPSKCKDIVDVLCSLGFEVVITETTNYHTAYDLNYDSKIGQEELFLKVIAPYVKEGSIEWKGEDDTFWKNEFVNGKFIHRDGYIVYK